LSRYNEINEKKERSDKKWKKTIILKAVKHILQIVLMAQKKMLYGFHSDRATYHVSSIDQS